MAWSSVSLTAGDGAATSGRGLARPAAVLLTCLIPFGASTLAGCQSGAAAPKSNAAASRPAGHHTGGKPKPPAGGRGGDRPASTSIAPLTGLPAPRTAATRAAVAAVVRVGPGITAPSGLDRADVVYAEYAGSPPLRLIALYHSRNANRVGPLGDIAPADAKLLPVTRALLAADGGPLRFRRVLDNSTVRYLSPSSAPNAYRLGSDGSLSVSTSRLRRAAPKKAPAPPTLFSYAGQGQNLSTRPSRPAGAVRIDVAGQPTLAWRWDTRAQRWRGHVGGRWVSAANVVTLEMPYRSVPTSNGGTEVSSADVYGEGKAHLFSVGLTADGRWRKAGSPQLTNIVDRAGVPFRLAPGRTWVVFVPKQGATLKVTS